MPVHEWDRNISQDNYEDDSDGEEPSIQTEQPPGLQVELYSTERYKHVCACVSVLYACVCYHVHMSANIRVYSVN